MRNLTVGLVIILGIGLLWLCSCGEPAVPEANGEQIMAYDMLDSVMDYIKQNHPATAPFIEEDIHWARSTTVRKIGYTRATYTGDGWTVAIGHAITAEVIYEVKAEYAEEGIVWVGTIKDGVVTEKSYTEK